MTLSSHTARAPTGVCRLHVTSTVPPGSPVDRVYHFGAQPLRSTRRVERRNFTRELSQIRTRRSPVIRLVPPSEGWRLPLQPQGSSHMWLATIKGSWSGWPVPLAPRALPRFNATTEQSIPGVSIATFSLGGLSPCTFSLNIARQVLTFPSEA